MRLENKCSALFVRIKHSIKRAASRLPSLVLICLQVLCHPKEFPGSAAPLLHPLIRTGQSVKGALSSPPPSVLPAGSMSRRKSSWACCIFTPPSCQGRIVDETGRIGCRRCLFQHACRFYVTPKSFLDLLHLYSTLLGNKRQHMAVARERLLNGLTKLQETNITVGFNAGDTHAGVPVALELECGACMREQPKNGLGPPGFVQSQEIQP